MLNFFHLDIKHLTVIIMRFYAKTVDCTVGRLHHSLIRISVVFSVLLYFGIRFLEVLYKCAFFCKVTFIIYFLFFFLDFVRPVILTPVIKQLMKRNNSANYAFLLQIRGVTRWSVVTVFIAFNFIHHWPFRLNFFRAFYPFSLYPGDVLIFVIS